MFKRKHILVLLLLIVGICAMSSVSAADNVTDVAATDAAGDDVVATLDEEINEDAAGDTIAVSNEEEKDIETQDVLASSDDGQALAKNASDEVLSAYPITYDMYSITLKSSYRISSTSGGTITFNLKPCTINGFYAFNFNFVVAQGTNTNNAEITFISQDFSSDSMRTASDFQYTFKANTLAPGIYYLYAMNKYDSKVMSSAVLEVSGNAVIAANDYNAYYNSGTRMTVTVKDKASGKPLKFFPVKAVFSNGKTSVTKYYYTNANGVISFVPTVNAGRWTVTFSSNLGYVKASAVKKNVVIKKSNVAIKAYNVKGYEGLKVTLKAVVKSQNRAVNNGIVTFIINGKSYNVAVKNGVASKVVVLGKSKIYTYYAIFKSANFNSPKKTYAKAVSLKRYATKIVAKNIRVYRSTSQVSVYIAVRTASGGVVKTGTVRIGDSDLTLDKYGRIRLVFPNDLTYVGQKGFYSTVYYKKAKTVSLVIRYIPPNLSLKPCVKKITYTELYRCTVCGSTGSHRHSDGRVFIVS